MLVAAVGGGRFLSQKPSQNLCPDTPPMLSGFETHFLGASAFFPRRVIYKGGEAAASILYVDAH